MPQRPRRRSIWTLSHQQQFLLLLLIISVQSVVVLQQHDSPALEREAFRQLQHDWQSYALTQRSLNGSFVPNWRNDSRCGPGWSAQDGSQAICNPFGGSHCCSLWGWCGQTKWHCNPGLVNPRNSTDQGDYLKVPTDRMHAGEVARVSQMSQASALPIAILGGPPHASVAGGTGLLGRLLRCIKMRFRQSVPQHRHHSHSASLAAGRCSRALSMSRCSRSAKVPFAAAMADGMQQLTNTQVPQRMSMLQSATEAMRPDLSASTMGCTTRLLS
jgi:hypothetical protein